MAPARTSVTGWGLAVGLTLALVACTAEDLAPPRPSAQVAQPTEPASDASVSASPEPAERPAGVEPGDFRRAIALDAVRHLAGTIGPREASGPAYERAARWVGRRFDRLGLTVQRQRSTYLLETRGACRSRPVAPST